VLDLPRERFSHVRVDARVHQDVLEERRPPDRLPR
jgi:hypothetical protein